MRKRCGSAAPLHPIFPVRPAQHQDCYAQARRFHPFKSTAQHLFGLSDAPQTQIGRTDGRQNIDIDPRVDGGPVIGPEGNSYSPAAINLCPTTRPSTASVNIATLRHNLVGPGPGSKGATAPALAGAAQPTSGQRNHKDRQCPKAALHARYVTAAQFRHDATTDGPIKIINNGGTVNIMVPSVIFVGRMFAFSSARMIRLSRISDAKTRKASVIEVP